MIIKINPEGTVYCDLFWIYQTLGSETNQRDS